MVRPVIRVPRVDTANGSTPSQATQSSVPFGSNGQGCLSQSGGVKQGFCGQQHAKKPAMVSSPKPTALKNDRVENRDIHRDGSRDASLSFTIPKGRGNRKVDFSACGATASLSKVPSLLFDMEDTAEDDCSFAENHNDDTVPSSQKLERLKEMLMPQDDDEYMLSMHVKYARDDALERCGEEMEVEMLGERLRALGYSVKVRTALGGDSVGGNASCLRNLRHCFLAVTLPNAPDHVNGKAINKELIVDPKFLDQFEIAHPTMRYDCILSAVPSAVVAPMKRIAEGVNILCEEMARAFMKTGTPLPPWRQTAAMLSKWQPRRSEDVDVMRLRNSAREIERPRLEKIEEDFKITNNTVAEKLMLMGVKASQVSTTPDQTDDIEALYSSDEPDGAGRDEVTGFESRDMRDPNNFFAQVQ